ncbi:MAG: GIY-YIG nuclease family protein [Alphaproteobacteria bacterium]
MPYYLYILASGRRGTLYIGVTNDLVRRVYEHRTDAIPGFTKKYKVHRLVYYEAHDDISAAIAQEKRMKRCSRAWKTELIEKQNEDWHDLWPTLGAWADERRKCRILDCHPGRSRSARAGTHVSPRSAIAETWVPSLPRLALRLAGVARDDSR